MNYYVVPRLSDGLGNRLFQYAVAVGLAKKWNRQVRFVKSFMVPTIHGDYMDFLKLFPDVPVEETLENPTILSSPNADTFNYREFPEDPPSNHVLLIDYRQNPCYFQKIVLNPVWNLEPSTGLDGSWMIHFRRGDYDTLKHYSINLLKYYRRCILAVPEGAHLRVFSDEPAKCKDLLEDIIGDRDIITSWSTAKTDITALHEMSHCTGGAITANSTFSWWGAYFAKERAPKTFQAFYPSSWGEGLPNPIGAVPLWGDCVDVR